MKFIEVSSEYDYGAMTFEQSEWFSRIKELWNRANTEEDGVLSLVINEDTDEEMELDIKMLEFENVSDDFLEYVLNELCDYDMLKHTCIYKVEED